MFPDYALMTNRAVLGIYKFSYFDMAFPDDCTEEIMNGSSKIVCINDSSHVNDFENSRRLVVAALDKKLSSKSTFET